MTEKSQDNELDALKSDIENLREELAGLAAGVKRATGIQAETYAAADRQDPLHDEKGRGVWSDLLHKLDTSRAQGEKVVSGLAAEVERQPLVSILAAFGLGYIIAKLWYQERSATDEDTNDAP